ncbi:DUF6694 family lipoprotein [Halodesulfovibrio sp. MK-HDV]|uniref:DUF6694 family lipoprotein n=1 Tax=Halodesulfovibrio sp. MK-HDV TaxID=2599925 RepID=UPI00136CE8BD|nr:DUF6694 family lipoprotein [Halodesulfovibrio sp. MK-HDV]
MLAFIFVGVGCSSEPTVDASSKTAFKQSIQEIYKSVPENEQQKFNETLTGMGALLFIAKKGNEEEVRKFFDGMTYNDIMEKAQEFRNRVKQ